MARILKGAEVSAAITEKARAQAEALQRLGITPTLAIVRMGDNDGDLAYERGAMKRCAAAGVAVRLFVLPEQAEQQELLNTIERINHDVGIHACLIFRPLPPHIDESRVRAALRPEKDVDGITAGSLAGLMLPQGQGFPPCTPRACIEILDHFGIELAGKRVTLIGRSLVVGRPLALMLIARDATLTICHSRTVDLPARCREADIVIAATGQAEMLGADCFTHSQTVIDVGISYNSQGQMVGDVDRAAAEQIVAALTPVPGGVGTVTSSVLAAQVIEAACRMHNRNM